MKTAKIPSSEKMKMKNSTKCLVAGWGKTSNEVSPNLQEAQVQVVNFSYCQKAWGQNNIKQKLPKNVMCAEGDNSSGPSEVYMYSFSIFLSPEFKLAIKY